MLFPPSSAVAVVVLVFVVEVAACACERDRKFAIVCTEVTERGMFVCVFARARACL